jgi:hypothetical protein
MSFFSNLFKRVPGGTPIGNFIRGAAKGAVSLIPGVGPLLANVVGNGAMMISQEAYDKKNGGNPTLANKELSSQMGAQYGGAIGAGLNQVLEDAGKKPNENVGFIDSIKLGFAKNKMAGIASIVVVAGGAIFAVIKFISRNKNSRNRRR